MREIKKTDSKVVISGNNQNQVLETFIYMKFDAECNKTTPVIESYRFHEDSEMFTKNDVRKVRRRTQIVKSKKKQGQIWNQRPLNSWRPLRLFLF